MVIRRKAEASRQEDNQKTESPTSITSEAGKRISSLEVQNAEKPSLKKNFKAVNAMSNPGQVPEI